LRHHQEPMFQPSKRNQIKTKSNQNEIRSKRNQIETKSDQNEI